MLADGKFLAAASEAPPRLVAKRRSLLHESSREPSGLPARSAALGGRRLRCRPDALPLFAQWSRVILDRFAAVPRE